MPTKRTYRRYRRRTRRYPVRRRTTYRRRAFTRTRAPEYKLIDSARAGVQATTSVITLLNGIGLGTDAEQRIGRKILNKSVSIKGYATNGSADSTQNRIMVVYDRRPNGMLPVIYDLLDAENTYSQRNPSILNRFVVLRDLRFTLSGEGLQGDSRRFSIYRRFSLPTYFNAIGNAAAESMEYGTLLLITITSLQNAVSFICDNRVYVLDT